MYGEIGRRDGERCGAASQERKEKKKRNNKIKERKRMKGKVIGRNKENERVRNRGGGVARVRGVLAIHGQNRSVSGHRIDSGQLKKIIYASRTSNLSV